MINLGAALGWKYDHAPGIQTAGGEITQWPGNLGAQPSASECSDIVGEYTIHIAFNEKKDAIETVMNERLLQGIKWKYDNGSQEYAVSLDEKMRDWMVRQAIKLQQNRVNPHGGFVRSGGKQFAIDDTGLFELCLFAGEWGDEISRIRISATQQLYDLAFPPSPTGTELEDVNNYDPSGIDWSVTWGASDAANGWNNDTLTQV